MHVLIISVGGLSHVIDNVLLRRRFIVLRFSFIEFFNVNNFASQLSAIKPLDGTNFEEWKETVTSVLALWGVDLALREKKPSKLTAESTARERSHRRKWKESNRKCLMFLQLSISKTIKKSIPKCNDARTFLKAVSGKFKKQSKAERGKYLSLLTSTVYDGTGDVHEHIMKMTNMAMKLRELKTEISDSHLVWQVLESLPSEFDVLKTSYNTQEAEWTLDQMTAIVVQEEETIRKSKNQSAYMVTHSDKGKKKFYGGKKFKPHGKKAGKSNGLNKAKGEDMKGKCFWCHKKGHMRKDCFKFKNHLAGTPLALVCSESNLVDVPVNSWWVDSGATIHVTNSVQGFRSKRKPSDKEAVVFMGNGEKVFVEFMGVVRLPLTSGKFLDLADVAFVPSLRRNLISISKLDVNGYSFEFINKGFVLYHRSLLIGSGCLCDGLYKLNLHSDFLVENSHSTIVVNSTIGSKRQREDGYADKSKGYRFYCPTYSMKIVESKHAVFLEEGADVGTDTQAMEFAFEEERSAYPTLSTPSNIVIPPLLEHCDEPLSDQDDEPLPVIEEPQPIIYEPELVMDEPQPTIDEPQPVVDVPVRRSQRLGAISSRFLGETYRRLLEKTKEEENSDEFSMLTCILELIYQVQTEKPIWRRRGTLLFPWFYYPHQGRKPFGTFKDIVGLVCALCQCVFATWFTRGVKISFLSTLGFDIELKFDDHIVYRVLQAILQVVFEYGKERPIIFSTFQPRAALLARKLQTTYPTFYDVRRNSLEEAVKVCLEGVYMQHLMGIDGVIVALVQEITE
ncbi:hypothetical protein EZV62_025615 [Acer yangbiense]|uniref:CCHC-type domain-containing protein n=1 Tax=Acer yangbiense TaxID=1000413 RepID=A0A5C7GYD6_9ROSI|nr:hypothetical protein EZV62_025615 [Acer yangbiense]